MKKIYSTIFLSIYILMTQVSSYAAEKTQGLKHTVTENTKIINDETRRKGWALSAREWTRYKELMQGMRGSISVANVSPIEVLGVHAKTDKERKKYAETWAKMMREDTKRAIAFQKAYDEANKRLYPNDTMFVNPVGNVEKTPELFKLGDRVLVFIRVKDCPVCIQKIQNLLQDEKIKKLSIDIYFIDTKNKKDNPVIRKWAKNLAIDKDRLKKGGVTLNHDNGNLYKITKQFINKVPLIFSLNKEIVTKINY